MSGAEVADDDADLGDEFMVGFENGVPQLYVYSRTSLMDANGINASSFGPYA